MNRPVPTRNVRFRRLESPGGGPGRYIERLFLKHRRINAVLSETGKWFLACMIWPRFVAPYRWQLSRYPMPLAGLHPIFTGYKILQLTDLHVGMTRVDYLAKVFDRCMKEKPDLVVLTGDLIDYQPTALPLLKELLRHLTEAPHKPADGFLAIFGNHDYHEYSWRHVGPRSAQRAVRRRWCASFRIRVSICYATSSSALPRLIAGPGSAAFTVVGLDEMWTGRANADHAFQGLSPADPVLCLQHNPDGVEFLRPYPWQFMLCGHSHGGQANFPVLGPLYVPMEHRQYLRGFFHFPALAGQRLDHRTMFVSTGLGHTTPIRLRCAPEATLFTLATSADPESGDNGVFEHENAVF